MKTERAILIAFLGNYVINTVIAALAALVPVGGATGLFTPQSIVFIILAVIVVAILAWWYGVEGWKNGLIFGAIGFAVSIVTTFVAGISGVVGQTGSLSAVISVLPNFGPFLWNWSTLILFCYWLAPAAAYGWWAEPKAASAPAVPPPMFSGTRV